jgi:HEAT repeat protein/predicted amidohydrolase
MVDQAEIHRKAMSGEGTEREEAAIQLGSNFAFHLDKNQAWKDLHLLSQDKNEDVRFMAADAIGTAFLHIPDKEQAWEDLHRLTKDKTIVKILATLSLGTAFPYLPDKEQAWKDLHRLTREGNLIVRQGVALSLGSAFPHISDKNQAWKDLIRLMKEKDSIMQIHTLQSLDAAFQYTPDKNQAWKDLHYLTQKKDSGVRRGAANLLGNIFSFIPDKEQVWRDLHRLTQDEDSGVRAYAKHSLGRASIFKATEVESEENFRKEVENSLKFFEESLKEEIYLNPSEFCLPFYRSFYAITFEKRESEAEAQKYITDAKVASEGSQNKETLLEAVENLANALTEVHKAREANLDVIKRNLNTYRQYCNSAADLIGAAEEKTPGAARVLRRGLPIIDARIKETIREIQERARAVFKQMRGTPLEELGQETTRYAQELTLQDPLALEIALGNLSSIARDWCEYIPADKKIHTCEQLKNLENMGISEQGTTLAGVFEYINTNIHIPRIQTVHISATQKEIVRIAVIQICFELTESFPFRVKKKDEVKAKIFSALDIARKDSANIVCLPELCLCEEWINEIKEEYPDMIVIGGSFYKDSKNLCSVITKSDAEIPYQPKITPSASEDSGIMESRMIPGDRIYRYETQFGRFVILICRDFDNLAHYFGNMTDIDMIFCPCFNSANERFHKEADVHVEKIPSYILIANAGLYGGTSIFGRLNKNYFRALVDGGCKDAGNLSYKLCEVKKGKEEVIIADFNLIYKSIQVPTPSDPNEEIRSVENIKKIPIQLKQRIKK